MIISQTQSEMNAAFALISKSQLVGSLQEPFKLVQTHGARANVADRRFNVEVAFHFQCFDASEANAPLFSVECTFDLNYELEEGYQPTADAIEAFKNGNAIFNCWPYARECVQSITSRMSLRPPPLPLLRIIPKQAEPKPAEPIKVPVPSEPKLTPTVLKE
jgi:hypothetical protein